MKTLLVGLALWVLPFVALIGWRGGASLHAREYRFFTQAALVTFGGAYAVLAYVTQAAVTNYGWLSQALRNHRKQGGSGRLDHHNVALPAINA